MILIVSLEGVADLLAVLMMMIVVMGHRAVVECCGAPYSVIQCHSCRLVLFPTFRNYAVVFEFLSEFKRMQISPDVIESAVLGITS